MVRREHVEKDHDCAGRYITGQHAEDGIVEAEEKERNLRAQVDIPCKATYRISFLKGRRVRPYPLNPPVVRLDCPKRAPESPEDLGLHTILQLSTQDVNNNLTSPFQPPNLHHQHPNNLPYHLARCANPPRQPHRPPRLLQPQIRRPHQCHCSKIPQTRPRQPRLLSQSQRARRSQLRRRSICKIRVRKSRSRRRTTH